MNQHDNSVTYGPRAPEGYDFFTALKFARSLCEGADDNSEYVRGQAELICDLYGVSMDEKESISAYLLYNSEWRSVETALRDTIPTDAGLGDDEIDIITSAVLRALDKPSYGKLPMILIDAKLRD